MDDVRFSCCLDEDGDDASTCAGDCDDGDGANFYGNVEICDGQDNDCDTTVDEGFDTDVDGFTSCGGDCNDDSGGTYPGAPELCDGVDNDCDGSVDMSVGPAAVELGAQRGVCLEIGP